MSFFLSPPYKGRRANGEWIADQVRASARFICPFNGCEITDTAKPAMLATYQEHRANTNAAKEVKSYRIPSFYSPRITFGDRYCRMKLSSRKSAQACRSTAM